MNRHLRRTRANVGPMVLLFCADCASRGARFTLSELEAHVQANSSAIPGTAGRVLRQLRKQGALGYRVRCGVYVVESIHAGRVCEALVQKQLFKFLD